MFDLPAARHLIEEHLSSLTTHPDDPAVEVTEVREHAFGWLFFYQSSEYLSSGNEDHLLAGNAPLIFERDTGRILTTGTAEPLEQYL